jgi:UDP-2,4-diacetamido-2,4,6-trideoxy-beta-L-altropyranose hydrolase
MKAPAPVVGTSAAGLLMLARTDASSTIGTGHVMRCLALAEAWRDVGGRATLISHDLPSSLRDRAIASGFPVEPARWPLGDRRDAEALATAAVASTTRVVVDGPGLTVEALEDLAPVAGRSLVFDDRALLERYGPSLVVNPNAHAELLTYPPGTRLLAGLRWAMLRREFARGPGRRRIPVTARRLLVAFGGTDPTGLTLRTLRAIESRLDGPDPVRLEIDVVVAATNPDAERIAALATRLRDVRVKRSVTDMASLMANADLAVTSGGSTVWELARMAVPSLVIEATPYEATLVSGLRHIGLFDTLGPAEDLDDARIVEAVSARVPDVTWRRLMATRGRRLVDGRGASRVAAALAAEGDSDGRQPTRR